MTSNPVGWRERVKEDAGQRVKRLGWRLGVEVIAYTRSVSHRRRQLLGHLGVDLVVDVGANIGQYAGQLRQTGYRGAILSIEPMASAYHALSAAARHDPTWEVLQLAVGDSTGTLTLNISDDDVYSSALPIAERAVAANSRAAYRRTEEVEVQTLDAVMANRAYSAMAVKIDVQGFESQVLEGGPNALSKAVFLELELSPRPMYDGQTLMNEMLQLIDDLGFTLVLTENVFPDFKTGASMQFNGVFARV